MKNEQHNDKLPGAVWGLLIFMACVLAALVIYWIITVMDILEQRKALENATSYLLDIYNSVKFPLT